jgi:hypothetical protein
MDKAKSPIWKLEGFTRLDIKGGGIMDTKLKNKRSTKKDLKKRDEVLCYDLCDPCINYYIVDNCGCLQYQVDPCGCGCGC